MNNAYPGAGKFTPFHYVQHFDTGETMYFPQEALQSSYRGFKFAKESGYQLYYLICPPNKLLPAELSGRYSKISILQEQVDKWLDRNQLPADATLPDVPHPSPPKKSHHKKPLDTSSVVDDGNATSEEPEAVAAIEPAPMSDSTRQLMEAIDLNTQD
jgi:hypothetical protein